MTDDQLAELWEQYQHELANDYGFGAPERWGKGIRNFAQFCAEKRIGKDFDTALDVIKQSAGGNPK